MLSLSTSFKSREVADPEAFVDFLESLDIQGVELEYRMTDRFFSGMKGPLLKSDLQVTSLHNYFPHPTQFEKLKPGGDLFLLSSPDGEERHRAIMWTARTIEVANELEAAVVILHCGRVEMQPEIQKLHGFFKENRLISPDAQTFIGRKLDELADLKPEYLDSLMLSLDRLIPLAEKQGVVLGLENRVHYHELPGCDDFEQLFSEFAGGPVGYWHDTGHAHIAEVLTLDPLEPHLEKHSENLVGLHFHDALGLEDHRAPGKGEIDFSTLKPFLKPEIPTVVELKPGTLGPDIKKGLAFMKAFLNS